MINYVITVSNESNELIKLLNCIAFSENSIFSMNETNALFIQVDTSKSDSIDIGGLEEMFHARGLSGRVTVIPYVFDGDFSRMKNNYHSYMNNGNAYIFQMDADEIPSYNLYVGIPKLLEQNSPDVIAIPRVNTIENDVNYSDEDIQYLYNKWRWNVSSEMDGAINFPDYQVRIYKVSDKIRWVGAVHERLVEYDTYGILPNDWNLIHHKKLSKQIAQNQLYDNIASAH